MPLILPTVDAAAVASVVADWTGIPVGRMVRNEIDTERHDVRASVAQLVSYIEARVPRREASLAREA